MYARGWGRRETLFIPYISNHLARKMNNRKDKHCQTLGILGSKDIFI